MTQLLKKAALQLMTEQCYDNYFIEFNFFHIECFKAVLSKCLGLGIIGGSLLVKVPQILKIVANKSGEGINVLSVLFDLLAITCHISYSFVNGFPFSAWGDGTFLAIQTAIIAALVFFYSGEKGKSVLFLVFYTATLYVLMGGLTSIEILWSLQACNVPVIFIGKLMQAATNFKNKSTGQLSATTCIMLFLGSIARIFTSYQETGDFMMILMYCVSSFANGIIVFQLIYYWNSDKKKTVKDKKEKSKQINKQKPKSKKVD